MSEKGEVAESKREREDGRWVVRRVTLVDVDPDEDAGGCSAPRAEALDP